MQSCGSEIDSHLLLSRWCALLLCFFFFVFLLVWLLCFAIVWLTWYNLIQFMPMDFDLDLTTNSLILYIYILSYRNVDGWLQMIIIFAPLFFLRACGRACVRVYIAFHKSASLTANNPNMRCYKHDLLDGPEKSFTLRVQSMLLYWLALSVCWKDIESHSTRKLPNQTECKMWVNWSLLADFYSTLSCAVFPFGVFLGVSINSINKMIFSQ